MTESPSPSPSRLWRPAAQRNLRNQWANLSSYKHKWLTLSSSARSHATSLVNSSLNQRFVNARDLGVLSDLPGIIKKASFKLSKQQELHRSKLLASYRSMVAIVNQMMTIGASMRCFPKGPDNSSMLQFSNSSVDATDAGDGGGVPPFTFWSISSFEKLAEELIQMFTMELNLKRLLVIHFISMSSEDVQHNIELSWMDELYIGEFDDLRKCNLYSIEACTPLLPKVKGRNTDKLKLHTENRLDADVLQVYLTTWLSDVNIDKYRLDEIFTSVGEEMNVTLV
ncbi:Cyclin-dependent kinase 2-interacting protein [Heracleum sosnowskyi]|uniref:Cyclin-dependent kinase 2-interacting protein n=1 Tax=Heracleum sosnowskyi TaxID=360622 RepID=A0AAD8IZC5_9APIA|nr:Cyclin-dependent kinase 2-interacting protein [Heracleum sosnowskyi]